MKGSFGRFFKKLLSLGLSSALVLTMTLGTSFADSNGDAAKSSFEKEIIFSVGKSNVLIDGNKVQTDIAPFVKDGRMMVPVSCISKAFGAKVNWNASERKVTIASNESELSMVIGSRTLTKDGKVYKEMETAPFIKEGKSGGRTMVPISQAAEIFNMECHWDNVDKQARFTKKIDKDIAAATKDLVFDIPGTYGADIKTTEGNVFIKSSDVILKDMNIAGNLYICEEVGKGDATLNNIKVSGITYVNGGGKNSIHINGGSFGEIIVGKTSSSEVRIVAKGVKPRLTVAKEAQSQLVRVEGTFELLNLEAPKSQVEVIGATNINEILVAEEAKEAQLSISENTVVESVTANQIIDIKNNGKIRKEIKGNYGNKVKEKLNKDKAARDEAASSGSSGSSSGSSGSGGSKPNKPNSKWANEDFVIEGSVIKGFSAKGLKKLEKNKHVVLPKTNDRGQSILEIGEGAFEGKISEKQNPKIGINSVEIPDTVTVIGKSAFRYQALTDIKLPKSIKTIKMSAFNGNKLQKLVLPDSLTELEAGAFTLNEISELTISKGLKKIPTAFGYNKLEKVVIPEGIERIDDLAFSDNDLIEVILPDSLEYLSGFNNNAFESFTIPKGVKELGKSAIARNKIGKIIIPSNVEIIGEGAFRNTWHDKFLTEVVFEEGLKKIDRNAFNGNHLTDIKLPDSLVELSEAAFVGNTGYDGVVHLYTNDYKNDKGLKDSKNHVINPAKLVVLYKSGEELIKEEAAWKNSNSGKYFVIGESYNFKPELKDALYETESTDEITVDFDSKLETVTVPCRAKAVSDEVYLSKVTGIPSIVVDKGTSQEDILKRLAKKTKIMDSRSKEYTVNLTWGLESYDKDKSGKYEAKATFKLPNGVCESAQGIKAELITSVIVKTDSSVAGNWSSEDFIYEGTVVSGFSKSGEAKFSQNKEVEFVLKNDKNENITGIAKEAFKSRGITKVVFPEGISNFVIGSAAFEKNDIEYVRFPIGTKEIDTYSFNENKLSYVEIPDSVKKIGNHTFANNEISELTFGENVEGIALDRFSFRNNKIVSTTILKQVKKVHGEAFMGNTGFADDGNRVHIFTTSFDPNDDNNNWFGASDYHRVIPIVDKSADFEINDGVITKYLGTETDLVIPDIISGQKVTAIGDKVFYKKGLTSVVIPDDVETIGKVSFAENALTNIALPYELKFIDMNGFAKNQIENIEFGDKLENIAAGAFGNNKLRVLEIPNSVKTIGSRAFTLNEIEKISLSNNLTEITGFAFSQNKIKEVVIPEGVSIIGRAAFKENEIEKLSLPSSIVKIDCGAFMTNKLISVDITEKASELCENAFDVGVVINKIKAEFWQLEDFVIAGTTIEGLSESGSSKLAENKSVKLPEFNKDNQAITAIADNAFSKKGIESVEIPKSVETIGKMAFSGNSLTNINLPAELKSIGGTAFAMNKIVTITFGDKLETIGLGAFTKNQVETLVIPESVTTIGKNAFAINAITSLSFSGNIKILDANVFSKNKLTSVVIPSGVEVIRGNAFSENQLTELTIPDSVTLIERKAFTGNNLTEVTLGSAVDCNAEAFDATVKINKPEVAETPEAPPVEEPTPVPAAAETPEAAPVVEPAPTPVPAVAETPEAAPVVESTPAPAAAETSEAAPVVEPTLAPAAETPESAPVVEPTPASSPEAAPVVEPTLAPAAAETPEAA